jgi:hypothetical protein
LCNTWEHGGCSPSVEQDALMKCCRYLECKQMCKEGIEPDDVPFVCLLSACGHAGLVDDEGMWCYGSMREILQDFCKIRALHLHG